MLKYTYANEQSRHGGEHGEHEDQADDLGRALGVRAEGMLDLGLLAVTHRLLVRRRRVIRVKLDVDVKDLGRERLGAAKGADDDAGLEWLGGKEELDGEVGLGLCDSMSASWRKVLPIVVLTISTTPLPLSFRVSGNGASSPVSVSLTSRKAWCGRLPLPPSLAVKLTLSRSLNPKLTGFESGDFSDNLPQR